MRLGISHIAWDASEDAEIVELLHAFEIDAIDIAPASYFPEPESASDQELQRVRRWWGDRGIEITGMQALLFGTAGMNMFGAKESREKMISRLTAVCRIAAGVGANRLVFGSPKCRDRTGLDDQSTMQLAAEFLHALGEVARSFGVTFCLEPVPERYGANFMTTAESTARVVRQVAHPSIRMHLDTGALTVNREDPETVLAAHAELVAHAHASEPDFVPLGDGIAPHAQFAACLERHLPGVVVAIEMLPTQPEPHTSSISRALGVATSSYRIAKAKGRAGSPAR